MAVLIEQIFGEELSEARFLLESAEPSKGTLLEDGSVETCGCMLAEIVLFVEQIYNDNLAVSLTRSIPEVFRDAKERVSEKILELKMEAFRFHVGMLFVILGALWFAMFKRAQKAKIPKKD